MHRCQVCLVFAVGNITRILGSSQDMVPDGRMPHVYVLPWTFLSLSLTFEHQSPSLYITDQSPMGIR